MGTYVTTVGQTNRRPSPAGRDGLQAMQHVLAGWLARYSITALRIMARATTPGRFVVPPTQAEEMYNPEVFGRTGASSFEVR